MINSDLVSTVANVSGFPVGSIYPDEIPSGADLPAAVVRFLNQYRDVGLGGSQITESLQVEIQIVYPSDRLTDFITAVQGFSPLDGWSGSTDSGRVISMRQTNSITDREDDVWRAIILFDVVLPGE